MKHEFIPNMKFSKKNNDKILKINEILEQFDKDGFILTLRQLYYQLVSINYIENKKTQYSNLSYLVAKARMAGLIDWKFIEDRIRRPLRDYSVDNISQAIEDTIQQYNLRKMNFQPNYLEVWCEKDALSQILSKITNKYGIFLLINRGYTSASAMYKAAIRIPNNSTILYCGDHDASGLDMVRDIRNRFEDFNKQISIVNFALTIGQVRKYKLPQNFAKTTDPRSKDYINKFGSSSWELDALHPKVLTELCENAIFKIIDKSIFDKAVLQEQADKTTIREMLLN